MRTGRGSGALRDAFSSLLCSAYGRMADMNSESLLLTRTLRVDVHAPTLDRSSVRRARQTRISSIRGHLYRCKLCHSNVRRYSFNLQKVASRWKIADCTGDCTTIAVANSDETFANTYPSPIRVGD